MKFIVSLVLLVAVFAWQSLAAAQPAGCHDEATNHNWPVGQDYTPIGQCAKIRCVAPGRKSALTCPLMQASPGCRKTDANLRRPYPECCPSVKC